MYILPPILGPFLRVNPVENRGGDAAEAEEPDWSIIPTMELFSPAAPGATSSPFCFLCKTKNL